GTRTSLATRTSYAGSDPEEDNLSCLRVHYPTTGGKRQAGTEVPGEEAARFARHFSQETHDRQDEPIYHGGHGGHGGPNLSSGSDIYFCFLCVLCVAELKHAHADFLAGCARVHRVGGA